MVKKVQNFTRSSIVEIKNTIIEFIKKESAYKSYAAFILSGNDGFKSEFNGRLGHYNPHEINNVLWQMIDSKEIKYEKGQHLTVV
jgi:hypothetical protein